MGAAGPLVPTEDRWAVIAYLRALQLSWGLGMERRMI